MSRAVIPIHGKNDHRANGPDPIPRQLHIKIFSDTQTVTTGDGKFIFAVSDDLGGTRLRSAEAFITTVSSSGTPTVQVRNITAAVDMLSTRITVDVSESSSYTAATRSVVDDTGTPPKNYVEQGDLIAIDVDVAGTGAKGLGVLLEFGPNIMRLTP